MDKKTIHCSHCGEIGHNTRTCPNKIIEDRSDYEEVSISHKESTMIQDFKRAQSFDIKPDIIFCWLQYKRPGGSNTIGKIKLCMDEGLNHDYLKLYIRCLDSIEEYY